MIDEKKLINHLQRAVSASDNPNFTNGLLSAIDIVKMQPEIGGWIPCSERLPVENGTYLASYEDCPVLMDWFNGKWFFYARNPAVEETGTIQAWMPLPKPYKE